jgi:hypothetical protein
MAWTDSRIFSRYIKDIMDRTTNADLDGDSYKAALYGSITPDRTVSTAALSSYNGAASQWVTGGEVIDATNWVAGGRALASVTWTGAGSAVMTFTANNLAGGGTLTLTAVFGCLIYDTTATPSNQGACFNYFGGSNTVTSGTFTINWNGSGIYTITV